MIWQPLSSSRRQAVKLMALKAAEQANVVGGSLGSCHSCLSTQQPHVPELLRVLRLCPQVMEALNTTTWA